MENCGEESRPGTQAQRRRLKHCGSYDLIASQYDYYDVFMLHYTSNMVYKVSEETKYLNSWTVQLKVTKVVRKTPLPKVYHSLGQPLVVAVSTGRTPVGPRAHFNGVLNLAAYAWANDVAAVHGEPCADLALQQYEQWKSLPAERREPALLSDEVGQRLMLCIPDTLNVVFDLGRTGLRGHEGPTATIWLCLNCTLQSHLEANIFHTLEIMDKELQLPLWRLQHQWD